MFNIKKKLLPIVEAEIKRGWSKESILLSIIFGCMVGIIPILGSTTILTFVLCRSFGLNQVIAQTVNYLVYPIQIFLWIPFIIFGANILNIELKFSNVDEFWEILQQQPWVFLTEIIWYQLAGVLSWALITTPICLLIYIVFKFKKTSTLKDS